MYTPLNRWVGLLLAVSLWPSPLHADDAAEPHTPGVGEEAADFTLESLRTGDGVTLSTLTAEGPVVLLVLRGYPTYQCPLCSKQVGDYLTRADAFAEHGARVVMVYPGPSDHLRERAEEFLDDRVFPEHFELLLDPDYAFTNLYALRWDAPQETAYPSALVIDPERTVRFVEVSETHGGRVKAQQTLQVLEAMNPGE